MREEPEEHASGYSSHSTTKRAYSLKRTPAHSVTGVRFAFSGSLAPLSDGGKHDQTSPLIPSQLFTDCVSLRAKFRRQKIRCFSPLT